ncbi:hypothetical protein NON00_08340 [Roseomonas sp. GC11]|uniref:hypothetical protein n=1 Tax=Roseomonas sp. GC11 TaxID=2950546 RepID=UPI002108A250|nr:hypothetical protein [Roseomonas sp. GC11]MCQ4159937.1 hypothetical protein [Roseomonas sp. GC11]
MSAVTQAARQLQRVLEQETAAARQALLPELRRLIEEKRRAVAAMGEVGAPSTPEEREALRSMMLAAEENALVLGAVAGALEGIRDRLRRDLAQAADPGLYGPGGRPRRRPPRHTLAASIDRTA